MTQPIAHAATVRGRYTVQIHRRGLGLVQEREFDNLITDAGLDHFGVYHWSGGSPLSNSSYDYWCHVGTGTAVPAVTDTALQSPVANGVKRNGSGVDITRTRTYSSFLSEDPPRRRAVIKTTATYAAGAIVGNLSEVGIGPGSISEPYALLSRALILDSLGNPTTVTATADDTVVVVYTLTIDWVGKTSGTITVGGVNYDYNTDFSEDTGWGGTERMWGINSTGSTLTNGMPGYRSTMDMWSSPSTTYTWTTNSSDNIVHAPYTNGNHYRDSSLNWGTGVGSPQIQGVHMRMGANSASMGIPWRIRFSSPIPFSNVQQFKITVRSSWGRA